MAWISLVLQAITIFLFVLGMACFVALVKGSFFLRRDARSTTRDTAALFLKSPLVPAVSIVATPPGFTPQSRTFVRRVLDLHYSKHEMVLVLNGPSENEMGEWIREFELSLSARMASEDLRTGQIRAIYESSGPFRLVLVDKERGSHADALNAGVNVAAYPVVGLADIASDFEPTILVTLVRPMLEEPEMTVAVCGERFVPSSGWVGRLKSLETLRLRLTRGAAFAAWDMLTPMPGSWSLIRRDEVMKAGGFRGGVAELFFRLHARARSSGKRYRIVFLPQAATHIESPKSFAELRRQTFREQAMLFRVLWRGKSAGGGKWSPAAIFSVRLLRPLLETLAYVLVILSVVTGQMDGALVGFVLLSTIGIGILLSMAAVVLRELSEPRGTEPSVLASLFFTAIPENLGYRQLRNLWLIAGIARPID